MMRYDSIKEHFQNFNSFLIKKDYNLKEKAYICGGGITGAITPLVVARYLLFPNLSNDWKGELFSWGAAILTNFVPIVFPPHLPAPVYTGIGGMTAGSLIAFDSKWRRLKKQRLERTAEGKINS